MRSAVTGGASGSLSIAVFAGDGVNPELITVNGVFVASGALLWQEFLRGLHFVRLTMTTGAGVHAGTQNRVDALGQLVGWVFMASAAFRQPLCRGVGILFHADMAVSAAQGGVHAVLEFGGVHVQAAARRGLHAGFAVAGQAFLVGGWEGLGPRPAQGQENCQPDQESELSSTHSLS